MKATYTSVMLIDDSEVDSLIHERLLKKVGLTEQILIHTGAKSAIEYLLSIEKFLPATTGALPSLIFLDIDMPLMDGFQFLKAFNKLRPETRSHIRIIMLTASTYEADNKQSKKHPYVKKYLVKPLTERVLKKLMQNKANSVPSPRNER